MSQNMLYDRDILSNIKEFLNKQLIILLIGSRQVGKTSLMRLVAKELEKEKISSKNQMLFFDLESINDLEIFQNNDYRQLADYFYKKLNLPENENIFIFIDEIQYLDKSSSLFKLLADHYPNIHLILSGSSSLEIKKIFTDRLTGRKILFNIPPLSFKEYLTFQENNLTHLYEQINIKDILNGATEKIDILKPFIKELLPVYEEFVIYGSYPRPSLVEYKNNRHELLREIRDTYVRKDISDIMRVENLTGFNRLLGLLAAQISNIVNIEELCKSSGLTREAVEKYLFLMQETFIISLIPPYFTNPRKELVKMPKIFFNDTGIRNTLLDNFQPLENRVDKGALVENAVYKQLLFSKLPIKYWRAKTKAEVDFIIQNTDCQIIPLEVKYQNFKNPQIPSGVRSFIERYNPSLSLIITKDFIAKAKLNKTIIHFLPALFL